MSDKGRWYNYKTGEYERIEMPSDFADYIPQLDATQEIYRAYLELGIKPIKALRKVLHAWAAIGPTPEALITTESLEQALAKLEGKEPLPEGENGQ